MSIKGVEGFTLIELLVVIAIIGLLAAIAIPQFGSYRNQAFCSRVESDVTNAMTVAEAYFAQNESYPADPATAGFTTSPQVSVTYNAGPPFQVVGTDDSGNCPKGATYTFTQGAPPAWS
ncbi:MAG: type IV pilin protein [Candidatus Binatia bacterium]